MIITVVVSVIIIDEINGYVDSSVSPTVTTRKQSLAAVKINIKTFENHW